MPWEYQKVALPFRIGFISLGNAMLEGVIQKGHFSTFSTTFSKHPPRELLDDSDAQAAFIPSCPLSTDQRSISRVDGCIRYIPGRYPHYYVDTNLDFDQYLSRHVSRRSRKSLRRLVRKFDKESDGAIDFRLYRSEEEAREFVAEASKLAQHTYQVRWLKKALPTGAETQVEAKAGSFSGYILFLKNKPVAFLWCRLRNGILEHRFGGYEPDLAKLGPGTVLDYLALQSALADDCITTIDLSEGDGPHKKRFATHKQYCGDIYYLKSSLKHAGLVWSHFLFIRIYDKLRRLLDATRIKPRIRRSLRKHVRGMPAKPDEPWAGSEDRFERPL
ncbi:MAG: GNAT family N-acetyltransferase [Gammaproteobacteria bacterium]|jgi:hypothetical protein|nr:GNAT family N-acetyltransferase [Gammaproteobacteria bacterium]MDP6615751.1 GNAT family N-acetyltransferase [Gammaproteobacteria bacterium]